MTGMVLPRHYAASIADFEYTHGIINMPSGMVWYRAYDPALPPLINGPLYFGDKATSWLYAQNGRLLGEFQPRHDLRVLDLRYVMSMLPYMIHNDFNTEIAKKITVALGLCTMSKQIELLEELFDGQDVTGVERMKQFMDLQDKPNWVNPFEIQGVRVGITDIDYEVMEWLKALFYPIVDGIIAPALPSPFHDQMSPSISQSKLLQELVLFDPVNTLVHLQDVTVGPILQYNRPTMNFNQLIRDEFRGTWLTEPSQIRWRPITIIGGGHSSIKVRDCRAEHLFKNKDEFKKWTKIVKTWQPTIKRIRKTSLFLQKVCFTMIEVGP